MMRIQNNTKATIILKTRSYHHNYITHTIKQNEYAETATNADVLIVIEEVIVKTPSKKKR